MRTKEEARDFITNFLKAYGPSLTTIKYNEVRTYRGEAERLITYGKLYQMKAFIDQLHSIQANLVPVGECDGIVVVYGNTYGLREELNKLGFTLKKVGNRWIFYRESLSDKYIHFKNFIEEKISKNVDVIFIKDIIELEFEISKIQEMKDSLGMDDLEKHEHDGKVFEISSWLAKKIQEQADTTIAYRNLFITKVKRETARAYQVDATYFSGISVTCGVCGRILDNAISKATGIGPICASRLGLARPTLEKAQETIKELTNIMKAQGELKGIWIAKSQIKRIVTKEELEQGSK